MSRLIKGDFEGANLTEIESHETQELDFSLLNDGRLDLARKLIRNYKIQGNVLEVGSGHSWMTGMVSKSPRVNEAWCLDSSRRLMEEGAPAFFKKLNADEKKITRVHGSWNKIPAKDNYFDFIIFEASLHHVPEYDKVLPEIKRVLKPNGLVLCTRERVVKPGKTESLKKHKLHASMGTLERIFSLDEYRFIAEQNFFHFQYSPLFHYNTRTGRKEDYAKYLMDKSPILRNYLAKKFNCLVFELRPKAYNP
jgi:ubiquinone/menaquinone biosynthesis C-methylase UbiE